MTSLKCFVQPTVQKPKDIQSTIILKQREAANPHIDGAGTDEGLVVLLDK